MKTSVMILIGLLGALCTITLAVPSPAGSDNLAISGTWHPLPTAQNETATWEVLPDRLRLHIPPKSTGGCPITCVEPVPDDDWSMDIWMVLHNPSTYYSGDATISMGKNGKGSYLTVRLSMATNAGTISVVHGDEKGNSYPLTREGAARSGAGPIDWLRISYSKQTSGVKVRVNGQLATMPDAAATIPSVAPIVQFKMNPGEVPVTFEILSYQITPGPEPDVYVPGAAYGGWQNPLNADGLKSVPDLGDRLQKLYADPRLTSAGRAYVLAALLLAEKASVGRIGDERWIQIAEFVQANGQTDPVSVLCLLPIAAASGDETQRAEVRSWTGIYAGLPMPVWREIADKHRSLQRISLIDPVLTGDVTMLTDRHLSLRLTRSLAAQLSKTDPAYALALHVFALGQDKFRCPKLAWMLPEIQAICPTYYQLLVTNLRERADEKTEVPREHDRSLSYAAYRLASTDANTALGLLSMIKDAQIKAEALPYVAEALTQAQSSDMEKTIEAQLKESISNWTASNSELSPVARYVRLAKWYLSKGRNDEAVSAVRECTGKLGESSSARFRSAREIAKMMFALKLPETEEWTNKAMEFALAADADGSDSGGDLYITATFLMVTDLLAQGRVDDALNMANKTAPDSTGREMALSAIIQNVGQKDMPRALELLKEYPQAGSRNSLVANLIRRMGGKDPDKAKSLFETIAPERKVEMAFRIGDALPREEMTKVCTDALTKSLKQKESHFGQYGIGNVDAWLADIDLATLFSFEPMFAGDYDRFAYQVLTNVANRCGIQEDWMWQCYRGVRVKFDGSGQLPWQAGELRRAINSESEQLDGRF